MSSRAFLFYGLLLTLSLPGEAGPIETIRSFLPEKDRLTPLSEKLSKHMEERARLKRELHADCNRIDALKALGQYPGYLRRTHELEKRLEEHYPKLLAEKMKLKADFARHPFLQRLFKQDPEAKSAYDKLIAQEKHLHNFFVGKEAKANGMIDLQKLDEDLVFEIDQLKGYLKNRRVSAVRELVHAISRVHTLLNPALLGCDRTPVPSKYRLARFFSRKYSLEIPENVTTLMVASALLQDPEGADKDKLARVGENYSEEDSQKLNALGYAIRALNPRMVSYLFSKSPGTFKDRGVGSVALSTFLQNLEDQIKSGSTTEKDLEALQEIRAILQHHRLLADKIKTEDSNAKSEGPSKTLTSSSELSSSALFSSSHLEPQEDSKEAPATVSESLEVKEKAEPKPQTLPLSASSDAMSSLGPISEGQTSPQMAISSPQDASDALNSLTRALKSKDHKLFSLLVNELKNREGKHSESKAHFKMLLNDLLNREFESMNVDFFKTIIGAGGVYTDTRPQAFIDALKKSGYSFNSDLVYHQIIHPPMETLTRAIQSHDFTKAKELVMWIHPFSDHPILPFRFPELLTPLRAAALDHDPAYLKLLLGSFSPGESALSHTLTLTFEKGSVEALRLLLENKAKYLGPDSEHFKKVMIKDRHLPKELIEASISRPFETHLYEKYPDSYVSPISFAYLSGNAQAFEKLSSGPKNPLKNRALNATLTQFYAFGTPTLLFRLLQLGARFESFDTKDYLEYGHRVFFTLSPQERKEAEHLLLPSTTPVFFPLDQDGDEELDGDDMKPSSPISPNEGISRRSSR